MSCHRLLRSVAVGTLLSAILLFDPNPSFAASVSFNTLVRDTAVDGGSNYGWLTDGVFDAITTSASPVLGTTTLYAAKSAGTDGVHHVERRAAFEFQLPAALNQPGVVINQATLYLPEAPYGSSTVGPNPKVWVYGYSADGQVTLSDFANTNLLVWTVPNTLPPFSADVTSFVQSLVGNSTHAGFVVAASLDTSYEMDANASMTIDYTAPGNSPPTVAITSPANNAQFVVGAPITFQGSAIDPENAGVSAISWSVPAIGMLLGTGPTVTTSSLPAGTHTILAQASDNFGQVGQTSITVSVVAEPSYCQARGNASNYEWIRSVGIGSYLNTSGNNGGYASYVSGAQVPVSIGANGITLAPGFSSSSYNEYWRVWVDFNRNNTFDTNELVFSSSGSSTITGSMNIPSTALTGPTRMRVLMSYGFAPGPCGSFGYGEVEDYTVNISAAPPSPPPPPPGTSFCASRGNNASYEWIERIGIGGNFRTSGRNSGYGDFTAGPSIPLARGSNSLNLQPGFSSTNYYEHWRVWVDFDQNYAFEDGELVYTGPNTPNAISSWIVVPSTAKAGATRMRVSMRYDSAPTPCGTFTYGEVEDYTVIVPQ